MHCWRLHGLPMPETDGHERFLSFALAMRYRGRTAYHIQAAQVLLRQIGPIAIWDAEHFFVPPGLWGIGIGGRFLARITSPNAAAVAPDGPLHGVDRLLVRITSPRHPSRATMKEVADLAQLYRDAGFRQARVRRLTPAMVELDSNDARATALAVAQRDGEEREWWFSRSVSPPAT